MTRPSTGLSSPELDDGVETALVWAARWTPDRDPRQGMMTEALIRCSPRPGPMRPGRRSLRWSVTTAVVAVVAVVGWFAVEQVIVGGPAGGRRSRGYTLARTIPSATGTHRVSPVQPDPTRVPQRPAQSTALTSASEQPVKRSGLRVASARIGTRPSQGPPNADAMARPTVNAPQWRTYTVPHYIAGVSTGGWLAETEGNGDSRVIPIMVDVPIAEGYGRPGDHDPSELDVIPVKHILEVYDE